MMIIKKTALVILLLNFVFCEQPKKEEFVLKDSDFQTVINGKKTDLYRLENGQIQVYITNYGGRIVSLLTPDQLGNMGDVVLGFKSIADYQKAKTPFHGCLIGRYGNRIAKGRFELDGIPYQLPINNNENHLHGGPDGFHNQVWEVVSADESAIVMTYLSKDGEMGYPGNLSVKVTYAINDKNELRIAYRATTDQATPINLTNHAFFNLAGAAQGSINDHLLMLNADHFIPVDEGLIPLGEIQSVEGSPFDFRKAKTIGQDLNQQASDTQLSRGGGYDHNFVLNKASQGSMDLAASVVDPKSGRQMDIFTEEPGIQFYGGNFMDGSDVGNMEILLFTEALLLWKPSIILIPPTNPLFPTPFYKQEKLIKPKVYIGFLLLNKTELLKVKRYGVFCSIPLYHFLALVIVPIGTKNLLLPSLRLYR